MTSDNYALEMDPVVTMNGGGRGLAEGAADEMHSIHPIRRPFLQHPGTMMLTPGAAKNFFFFIPFTILQYYTLKPLAALLK